MVENLVHYPDGVLSVVRRPAPGRLRLAVRGLYRRRDREAPVASALAGVAGVRLAEANAVTGKALVLFDPEQVEEAALLREGSRVLMAALDGHPPTARRAPVREPSTVAGGRALAGGGRAPVASIERAGEASRTASTPALRWHAMGWPRVAQQLGVDPKRGLTATEAAGRIARFGPNRLPEAPQPPLLRLFLGQLVNVPTALLAAGAILSVFTGGVIDAVLIGSVALANATIGAATERSGNRAIAALRRTFAIRARVRRDGVEQVVPAEDLVPGDVIKLMPGDPVPADARLVFVHRLQVEESALTGESQAVDKDPSPVSRSTVLADRRCLVYRGTTVVAGHGEAIVVATGGATAIGGLRILAAKSRPPQAPLERDLNRLGEVLALSAFGICSAVFGLSVLRGTGLVPAASAVVSLGVAAIPEGLTAIATTVLALGSGRMRKKGTLIRTLTAAETLGSVTVVCADKTGTITENRMAARECAVDGWLVGIGGPALSLEGEFRVAGREVRPEQVPGLLAALRVGLLCNDAEIARASGRELVIEGSATEGAILIAAAKAGLDPGALGEEFPRVDRRDRGNGRRYMVTVHRAGDVLLALAKGSPDEILKICDRVARAEGSRPLDDSIRADILARNSDMASRGMRVLAVAERELPEGYGEDDLVSGYLWRGLIGLDDPIRPAVPGAIRALHRAGIRTVMITGDQAPTATAVARELSLSRRGSLRYLEAADLASLPPDQLRGLVRDVGIFARVPPELKLAVVQALQANGDIVAMTGDGVNDAPALRAADVGLAMGERGTELARELADVVLSTDDFSRIVDAVEEGRLVRRNVQRVLHYLLTTNATEVWTVAAAVSAGLPFPFTPLQLLWINLLSDLGPALGLATEPPTPDLMARPPRDPQEPIVTRGLWRRILAESLTIAVGALATYGLGIARHGAGPAARTMAFASLGTAQLLHMPLARIGDRPAIKGSLTGNRVMALGIGFSALLLAGAVFFPPLRAALGGGRIGLADTLISAAGAAIPIVAIQSARLVAAPGRARRRPASPAITPESLVLLPVHAASGRAGPLSTEASPAQKPRPRRSPARRAAQRPAKEATPD